MQRLQDTIIGTSGIGLVEIVPNIIPAGQIDYAGITQTAIQIIIGLITLLGLFRKRKSVTN